MPRIRIRSLALTSLFVVAVFVGHARTCFAGPTWTGTTNQDWNNNSNWGSSAPSGNLVINNAGPGVFPLINGAAPATAGVVDINVGLTGGTGRLDQRTDTLTTGNGNWMRVGVDAGSNGTYNLANTGGAGGTLTSFALGSGSMNVGGTSTTSGRLTVGNNTATGTVNMFTTGTLKLEQDALALLLGDGGTSTGNFNLDGGTLQINGLTTEIGILAGTNGGDGNFRMSGGTVNLSGGFWAGDNNAGSQGLLQISGGSFNLTATSPLGNGGAGSGGQLMVGKDLGQGTMTVSGGAVTITGPANIGFTNTATAGTTGLLTVSGGTFSTSGDMRVGSAQNGNGIVAAGSGTFNVSGGTASIGGLLQMASGNDAGDLVTGTSTISGTGILNVQNDLVLAYAGNNNLGTMNINGGTVNVGTVTERWFIVNRWDTSRGQLTVNGGTLNLNANSDLRFSTGDATNFGSTGASTVTLTSGAITSWSGNQTGTTTTGVVDLNRAGGAVNNTFNLDGGTLTINQVMTTSNNGTTVFNFNGGTLKAAGNTANFVDLGGGTQTAVVKAGGAIVDSNGFDVTIPQALLAGAPSGGLTKNGNGTLSLSGANTFTGNLTVNSGTVAAGLGIGNPGAAASQSSAVGDIGTGVSRRLIVNNGGTLSLTAGNTLGTGFSTNTLSGVTLEVNAGGLFRTGLDAAGAGWWNKIGAVDLNGGTISVGSGANNTNFQGLALIGTVTVGGSTASTINNLASSDAAFNAIHLGQNATAGQSITFNVANVTGDANPDLTIAAKLIDTSANLTASGLTKTGAGTMVLSGANTFSGDLTASSGTLEAGLGIGNPAAAASQSSAVGDIGTAVSRRLIVNNGGTLSLTAGNTLGTGFSTNTLSGVTLEVNAGGLFRTGKDGTGAGWWNKIGAVDLNGGTISVGSGANNTNFQGLALIGTVTVGGSTASTINNLASSDGAFNAIHLGQNATAGQSITFDVANVTGDANPDLTIAAKLINTSANLTASGLTKTGAGTMELSAVNTYSGNTLSNGGILAISATGSITQSNEIWAAQGASGQIDVNGGSIASPNFIVAGRQNGTGTINLNTGTATSNFAVSIGALRPTVGSTIGIFNVGGGGSAATLTTNELWIAEAFGGGANPVTGTLNVMNNGLVNVANFTIVGFHNASSGTLNASGGMLTTSHLIVANDTGSTGLVTQNGGNINVTALTTYRVGNNGSGVVDSAGTGTVNHSAGLTNVTGGMVLGDNPTTGPVVNSYNLSGTGNLNFADSTGVSAHHQATPGSPSTITINADAAFNFTGGTLRDVSTITPLSNSNTFTQGGGTFIIGQDEISSSAYARTTINGGFSLLAGGTVKFDAFGPEATTTLFNDVEPIDLLRVTGTANLNGLVDFDDHYGAEFGDVHTLMLMLAPTINLGANFAMQDAFFRVVPTGPTGPGFALQAIVPEPASVAVWTIIGLAGVAGMWRCRRRTAGE